MDLLPQNNLIYQYRNAIHCDREERKLEIMNCSHLFVKLHDYYTNTKHSTDDTIECVRCGLTNKFITFENRLLEDSDLFTSIFSKQLITLESQLFSSYSDCHQDVPLLSKEMIYSLHPRLLYQLALSLSSQNNMESLFEIMQKLNSLETESERLSLFCVDQSQELITRYQSQISKPIVFIKK